MKALSTLLAAFVIAEMVHAAPNYWNRDNTNTNDSGDANYNVPYSKPQRAEIVRDLERVRAFMESASVIRVVDRKTGEELTDVKAGPVKSAALDLGASRFSPLAYDMGVVYSGMLRVSEVTGDTNFAEFTARRLQFIRDWRPYFQRSEELHHLDRSNPFGSLLEPDSLDDSGSMCAALVRAKLAGVGPDLKPQIDVWSDFILNKQFRLPDGTLARQRPQRASLWADDAYMCIPALAEMGRLTGDRKWFDDAVKQALQLSQHLFVPEKNLHMHGKNLNNPDAPHFFWGRANGWVVLAHCDLLDVLPKEHPGFAPLKARLEVILRGVAGYQDGTSGLWHQMLDRPDSYLETSASAIFVYGLAHAINQGWISPTTYGSIAQAGWNGLSTRINQEGQVEGTCVGTTFGGDQVYYYHRPASVWAMHGYGPVLFAGAEMIRLLENPAFEIQYKNRTYHYLPKESKTDNKQ
ncbi:MAG: glycoside hydrolase family 88 protein [Verrucomicrobiota bacterium]